MYVYGGASAHQVSEDRGAKCWKNSELREMLELGAPNAVGRHENSRVCKMLKLHNIFSPTLTHTRKPKNTHTEPHLKTNERIDKDLTALLSPDSYRVKKSNPIWVSRGETQQEDTLFLFS